MANLRLDISPSELRDNMIIQVEEETYDDNGFPTTEYVDLFNLYCKKKTVSTKEKTNSPIPISKYTLRFLCRNREVDNKMYILYKGERYNITHVHELSIDYMEITAERVG